VAMAASSMPSAPTMCLAATCPAGSDAAPGLTWRLRSARIVWRKGTTMNAYDRTRAGADRAAQDAWDDGCRDMKTGKGKNDTMQDSANNLGCATVVRAAPGPTPLWASELVEAEREREAVQLLFQRASVRLAEAREVARQQQVAIYNEARRAAGLEPRAGF
jgi:hypothetical protein